MLSNYQFSLLMDMTTLFCITSHGLSIVIFSHLTDCSLMVKSIGCTSTGAVFSGVQYYLGYCEGEMACVLMRSPEIQRPSV